MRRRVNIGASGIVSFSVKCATTWLVPVGAYLLCVIFALNPVALFAQRAVSSYPEVSATLDRVEAFVGDALSFTVSIIADSTTRVAPLNIDSKLGDFEIQDVQRPDPETLKDGRKRYRTLVKLWALETGERQIPSLTVYFANQANAAEPIVDSMFTSAITVTVSSIVGDDIDSASIKPLRDPLEDPLGLSRGLLHSPLFWGSLITIILLIGALAWWMVLRRRKDETEWVDPRSAWEIALDRLVKLQNEPYLAQGLFKLYYSELTDTLRDYLGSAMQTHTLDMTTAELLSSLEENSLTVVYKPQISSALTQADMVKFARAIPSLERPKQDFETVYSVIISIRDGLAELRRKEEERQKEWRSRNGSKIVAGNNPDELEMTGDTSAGTRAETQIGTSSETLTAKEVDDV